MTSKSPDVVEVAERELALAADAHAAAKAAVDQLSAELRAGKTVKPETFATAQHEAERTALILEGCQERLVDARNEGRLNRIRTAAAEIQNAFDSREHELQAALNQIIASIQTVTEICDARKHAVGDALSTCRREKIPARGKLRGNLATAASATDGSMTYDHAGMGSVDRVFVDGREYSAIYADVLIAKTIREKRGNGWLQRLAG